MGNLWSLVKVTSSVMKTLGSFGLCRWDLLSAALFPDLRTGRAIAERDKKIPIGTENHAMASAGCAQAASSRLGRTRDETWDALSVMDRDDTDGAPSQGLLPGVDVPWGGGV